MSLVIDFLQADSDPVVAGLLQLQVEGAKLVHRHELRLRMDAAIGRAPPISDMEMQVRDDVFQIHHFPTKDMPNNIMSI